MTEDAVDYIVVGAGGAGAVIASRLSEDPGTTVLLLERGGRGCNPLIHIPKGYFYTMKSEKTASPYISEPSASGERETWLRGRGLGGSTAINGMIYIRGQQTDFDALEAAGNPGWGWRDFLGAFKAIEDHSLGGSEMRGAGGPVRVTVPTSTADDTVKMMVAAAERAGWPFSKDVNENDAQHIGFTPTTTKNGVRQGTATAFLKPARGRNNLKIVTGAHVDRVLFEGRRAVGVLVGGKEYRARKEVILSAGAIETPAILERSGIGRRDVLSSAGIELRVESPNVGERLIEQHGVALQVRLRREIGHTMILSSRVKQLGQGVRYLLTRKGPIGTPGFDLVAHIKSRPELDRPDIQLNLNPFALDTSGKGAVADYPGLFLIGYQVRPNTQSSVHVTSSNPVAPLRLEANYLRDEEDRRVTATIIEHMRTLLAQDPLASEIESEIFPGKQVRTQEDTLNYALSPGATIYHAVGSAAMGPNDDDVVSPDLRVRGVDGLRVADISVLPRQISGNTSAQAMAIGWLGADLIRRA